MDYIRLFFTTAAAYVACRFVHFYTAVSMQGHLRHVPHEGLPTGTLWLLSYSIHVAWLPVLVGCICLWSLRSRSWTTVGRRCVFELCMGGLQLFTVAWPLVSIVLCETPLVPMR